MEPTLRAFIDRSLNNYPRLYNCRFDVLHQLFAVLGNGFELDDSGFLIDEDGLRVTEAAQNLKYDIPAGITCIVYPWTIFEQYQPFRKYIGCKTSGFDAEVEYFIKCIREEEFVVSVPNNALRGHYLRHVDEYVNDLKTWKKNIHIMEEVLRR